ncbi:ribosomal protein S6 modification protein [Vespertiliibacter pulmonis]|uniref:SSU ribosomal protein S6P modification protein n=1 Tax=Vespertiliibacter pulmonis TaxID=1443036 RepID=A0A3N4WJ30_9PAST|nr:RimK family alpha-L-glutamate ligase [Vespertiliibacter pulmonis]QLB21504.1 ribosomal protein S6 modification protein [Vespertiliibacter pulmonis]RPE85920.1 SSU ribosomal protein S6P modification protein [Vespertiliibacter pulmonis]
MKLLILCREPRLYSCQRLKSSAEAFGYSVDILDPSYFMLKLTQGKFQYSYPKIPDFIEYQGIIPRFGTTTTEIGCNVLSHFELQGIPVLNSTSSVRLARNKWQSLQKLVAEGISVPNTILAGELCETKESIRNFSCPFIIKTLSGSQGIGVMLSESQQSAVSLLDTLKSANIPILTQQFIKEAQGEDIRAFVIGNEVVASMVRQGTSGEFRANIHQGGTAKSIELSQEEKQLAVKAAKTLGLDVAGVDLIRSKQGLMVLEVNASPGLEMIEKVSGIDIARKMIHHLICKKVS